MARYSNPFVQYLSATAAVLDGNKLDFFEPGTTTPKNTFSDSGLTTANPNPVVADAAGRIPDIFLDGTYKVVLKDKNDVTIDTADPVGETTAGELQTWLTDVTYNIPDLVKGSDNRFYRSLTNANQGNDPTTSAANWEQIEFERIFNVNVTYSIGNRSIGSDGKIYRSLTNSNLGNDPTSDTTNWGPAITNFPTQSTGDSTALVATTAFVQTEISASASAISGLVPSNAADADHDITISTGQARDSAGAKTLTLSSAITKQLDAAFVEGNDAGGLFTGTIAADTTYHLFIIQKDSDGSIDAGFDTSLTAANIPTGFTAFRRVGSFETNSSSNLVGFTAIEAGGGSIYVNLDARATDVDTTSPGTSAVLATLSIPQDFEVLVHLDVMLRDNTGTAILITSPQADDVAPNTTNADISASTANDVNSINCDRLTNTVGQIRYRSNTASGLTTFKIFTLGWTDFRR